MEMVPTPDTATPLPDFAKDTESNGPIESSKLLEVKAEDANPPSSDNTSKAVPVLIPSLKGKMSYVGGIVHCKGRWAMSDAAHDLDGQSSEFEFKLIKADENSGYFPVNGMYQGWFALKQTPPAKGSVKIEDKEMVMRFIQTEDSKYSITGQGLNKFGKFVLRGTLDEEGHVHLYREYVLCTPVTPAPSSASKKSDSKKASVPSSSSTPSLETKKVTVQESSSTPRESTGRVRKQSALLKDYTDTLPLQKTPSKATEPASSSGAKGAGSSSAAALLSASERTHRLNPVMKRCLDLLKEMSKYQHAQWFLEPVDPIKYNIPDYPKIIKQPMDFSTIRNHIEQGLYDSVDGFAEHVRLVFRNAITFNTSRESLVNIAAREMSIKFEDKFRALVTQLDPTMIALPEVKTPKGFGSGKKGKANIFVKAPPGPRPGANYLPPAALDGSTHQILEMQRMMQAMQDEINQLRASVREKEVLSKIQETREAALNPLTFDEKKALVAQIHKLSPEKMDRVLEIIQEAVPDCGEEVEVPIDSLDTLTLRKLQKFVQDNGMDSKKRPNVAITPKNQQQPAAKKARRGRMSNAAKLAAASANGGVNNGDLHATNSQATTDLEFFEDEELLFEAESLVDDVKQSGEGDESNVMIEDFEQLKRQAMMDDGEEEEEDGDVAGRGVETGKQVLDNDNNGGWSNGKDYLHQVQPEEDDDANMWSTAASEMPAQ